MGKRGKRLSVIGSSALFNLKPGLVQQRGHLGADLMVGLANASALEVFSYLPEQIFFAVLFQVGEDNALGVFGRLFGRLAHQPGRPKTQKLGAPGLALNSAS